MIDLNSFDNDYLFSEFLKIINRELGETPNIGIIAGQVVSSACLEFLNIAKNSELPYNDIDIFVHNDNAPYCEEIDSRDIPAHENVSSNGTHLVDIEKSKLSIESGVRKISAAPTSHDLHLNDPIELNGYSIFYSYRCKQNPNINYIRVKTPCIRDVEVVIDRDPLSGKGDIILNGFDLTFSPTSLRA